MKRPRLVFLPVLLVVLAAAGCEDQTPLEPTVDPNLSIVGRDRKQGASDQAAIQAALDAAAATHRPSVVRLAKHASIHLDAPLTYTGEGPLLVRGSGATLHGPDGGNAFESTGGADLRFDDLTVAQAGAHGIYVAVPAGRTGVVRVAIDRVVLKENGFAGLWVDDQVHDSPASVSVQVHRSRVLGNNTAGVGEGTDLSDLADKDGIRVNEGGPGDLRLDIDRSWFEGNEADALELDETGTGDVHSAVRHTSFVNNGTQRQFPDDLEDGFDIDEAGEGSIHATFVDVFVTGHLDEGIDLDELDAGSVYARMTNVRSIANSDDNISITESEEVDDDDTLAGEGDIVIDFRRVDASGRDDNGDGDGIKLEEFGEGDVNARIARSRIADNDDDGIQVDESGPGGGLLRLIFVLFEGNLDDDVNSDVDVVRIPQP
jgi:hypothetical protein